MKDIGIARIMPGVTILIIAAYTYYIFVAKAILLKNDLQKWR